jgi:alpha-L-fucosidase
MTPKAEARVERFEKLAYGMFVHWGLYSLLGRGEWLQNVRDIPKQEYEKLKSRFMAEEFSGRKLAQLAKRAGMKYVVLTTRHHDGFSLFDTRGLNDWDAVHSPAGRDLVADFADGCRAEGIIPFFYHTTLDWHDERFEKDFDAYLQYLRDSVEILCTHYGPIGGMWFDGNWSKPGADWQEGKLYGLIRSKQPDAIIVNNTGLGARGATGHPEIDSVTFEQGRPTPMDRTGMKKYLAAEMCQTMNMHWGIGSQDFYYLSPKDIIENLCACRKVGANYLLNIGPEASGRIPEYEAAALTRAGDWVKMYDMMLRKGKPAEGITASGSDFALETDGELYLFIHGLVTFADKNVAVFKSKISPRAFSGVTGGIRKIEWIDNGEELAFAHDAKSGLLCVNATPFPYGTNLVVRVAKVFGN